MKEMDLKCTAVENEEILKEYDLHISLLLVKSIRESDYFNKFICMKVGIRMICS
jgi:hypothetical protein